MIYFNKHKKALVALMSIAIILYAGFLFVLPNIINLNNYKNDIQKVVSDSVKLDFDTDDMKIVTTPDLKAGVRMNNLKLSYPDKKEIVSLNSAEVKISILPLIFKTVRISDVTVDSPDIILVYTKDGKIDIAQYILSKLEKQQTSPDTAAAELPVKLSDKLPDVIVKNYKLTLKDEKTSNTMTLKGENFILDKAVLNKHFRISSKGKILLNSKENINYDIRVSSFWPLIETAENKNTQQIVPQIDFINEIVKYNPKADINADLKIKEHAGHTDFYGEISFDKSSIVLDGQRLPDSFMFLMSSGHKTTIDSSLYISDSEKAVLKADINHGRKLKIDVNAKTDKISFSSIQKFASALLNSLNIENDLAMFNTKGYINADFTIKSDMKNIESNGFFRVLDGSVSHKTIPVKINSIIADVDFANNNINIKNASANINDTRIEAKGSIDSMANTDLTVKSGKINIAPLFNAFAPVAVKKSYILNNGILDVNILIKGRLADIEPNINVSLKGLALKDRINTFSLKNDSVIVNIKTKGNSFTGDIDLNGSSIKMFNPSLNLVTSSAKLKITPDQLTIVPFTVSMNASDFKISGSVKDYMKKMKINILLNGNVNANDLKKLLPVEARVFVGSKGVIPLNAAITGNDKKIDINAQAKSDADNYFSPVTIKKMIGNIGLVNVSLSYANDNLNLNDVSLYQASKSTFSDDFSFNKKGALKIVGLTGLISDLSSSHPALKMTMSVPEQILLSNSFMPESSLKAKGEVNLYGVLDNPSYKGFFILKDINLPDFLIKIQDVDLEFNDTILTAKVQNLNINGTPLNIDADASTVFSNVFLIKTMKVTSTNFDVDNLFKALDKINTSMPVSSSSSSSSVKKGPVVPVKITNGVIDIQKFKMKQAGGDFIATNITGDFNLINDLFKLNNLKASVYNGTVTGNVSYNLASTIVSAIISAKGLNANSAVTVFASLKDQIIGNVDFNANITLKGVTYEQQMKSLNGKVNLSMKDGQMGSLGRFETFLKADNLISQGFIGTKIGYLINTIAPYNTGKFSYLSGDIIIRNGIAKLNPVKMSGPHMSLLINGDVNILSMISTLQIMGSLSPDVTNALGPVADLSVEKFASYIPKFGAAIANALNTYNAPANNADIAKIPALSPQIENTKSFKVLLNGNLNNPPSAVRKFQWLNSQEKINAEEKSLLESIKPTVPANKEELKQQLKDNIQNDIQNRIENNEKIQEFKQNKAVKTIDSIYKFYKNKSSDNSTVPNQ